MRNVFASAALSWDAPLQAALAIALGILFLGVFYATVRSHWPESYFAGSDSLAVWISSAPGRYLLFQFAPVFAACTFAAVSLERLGHSGVQGSVGIGVGHAARTFLRAFPRRRRGPSTPTSVRLLRGLAALGVLATSSLAALTADFLAPAVPPVAELSATLWTGLLAAVVGAFLIERTDTGGVSEYSMIEHSRKRIPDKLWHLAHQLAQQHGADVKLVRAVMLVENLQRPEWFRRIERLKGRLFRSGTYGIMQVASAKPLSDEISLERAVRERFAGVVVQGGDGYLDDAAFGVFLRGYNRSRAFKELTECAYHQLNTADAVYGHLGEVAGDDWD